MTRTMAAALTLLAAAPQAQALVPEPDVDYVAYTAYLAYPPNGALEVSANTLVFAPEVTAMQLLGPTGATVTCLLDPEPSEAGAVFEPMELLEPVTYHVLGVPTERADNYAGPGVTIDLGSFAVGDEVDEQAPTVSLWSATWISRPDEDELSFSVGLDPDSPAASPVHFEIDLADADTPYDGAADLAAPWTEETFFSVVRGGGLSAIDAATATARVRAVDAAGNVGAWSDSVAFDVRSVDEVRSARGCSAAPGRTTGEGGATLFVLTALWGLGACRRRVGRTR